MVDQLAANALTTEARVRESIGQVRNVVALINSASDFVQNVTGRRFARADIVEQLSGYGTARLRLSRRPIVSLDSITLDGATLDLTGVTVCDAEAGLVERPGGWPWTVQRASDISNTVLPGTERTVIAVTYRGGYVTPQFDGAAGAPYDGDSRDLPYDIEQAVFALIKQMDSIMNRDPAVAKEKLMSWEAEYRDDATSPFVQNILDRYRIEGC